MREKYAGKDMSGILQRKSVRKVCLEIERTA